MEVGESAETTVSTDRNNLAFSVLATIQHSSIIESVYQSHTPPTSNKKQKSS